MDAQIMLKPLQLNGALVDRNHAEIKNFNWLEVKMKQLQHSLNKDDMGRGLFQEKRIWFPLNIPKHAFISWLAIKNALSTGAGLL